MVSKMSRKVSVYIWSRKCFGKFWYGFGYVSEIFWNCFEKVSEMFRETFKEM